jgi:Ser/Thr protein kinase RdoA (MazF antagonist)
MLEQSDIAHYLLSLGLVKPREVVEERLTIVDASRRNCVFLASVLGGPTYAVKQARPRTAQTLEHEAAVLRVLADEPDLSAHVPTVVHHESRAARLILRTPGEARDWSEHHRAGRFPRLPARVLGRVLGALHRLRVDAFKAPPSGLDPMWGLSLPEPPHELLLDLSAGARDLVARLQASHALCDRIEELRREGSDGVFVHGDLRWDNCLVVPPPGSRRRTQLLLVDWELAGPGRAGFDVGTVLGEYLRSWVESIPIVDPGNPGRLEAQAAHPLRRMEPAIHAFWSAYGLESSNRPTLEFVTAMAALHILQAAVEHTQELAAASAHAVTLLQLADNMLCHPDEAALNLLGLRE